MRLTALKVIGPFRGPTGYDHHVREFVRELHRQGVPVELSDLPGWSPAKLPRRKRDPWFDTLNRAVHSPIVLHFCMPHQVKPEPDRLNVNHTMFEADRIPAHWAEHSLRHDLVLVPTESSRSAWLAGGITPERVQICPLGINPEIFGSRAAPLQPGRVRGRSFASYRTRFLNISELTPRKNLVGLLRAWLRTTRRGDDAVILMKIGRYLPGDFRKFRQHLKILQRREGKSFRQAAPVQFLHRLYRDEEMPGLYRAATHYISLSFAEGWDQTMVEAAASGLNLIAPHHSAYTSYLDETTAHLIPSRAVSACVDGDRSLEPVFNGALWWQPDEDAAAQCIREVIDGSASARFSARENILRDWTWSAATRTLIKTLEELLEKRSDRSAILESPRAVPIFGS